MTDDRLAALDALARRATPGPWEFWHEKTEPPTGVYTPRRQVSVRATAAGGYVVPPLFDAAYQLPADYGDAGVAGADDLAFVAAADPTTVLALCGEIRRLKAATEETNR